MKMLFYSILVVLYLSFYGTASSGDDQKMLDLINESYKANKASFKHGKCRYEYSLRASKTEEDAFKENFNAQLYKSQKSATTEWTIYFKDQMFAQETDIDSEKIKKLQNLIYGKDQEKEIIVPPEKYLVNGDYSLDFTPYLKLSGVYSPDNNLLKMTYQPFNLASDGDISLSTLIDYVNGSTVKDLDFSIKENVKQDGHDYLQVKVTGDGASHDIVYYLDPEKGYLCFVQELYIKNSKRLYSRMRLLDVHEENGNYFPMHAISAKFMGVYESNPKHFEVREMKVLELDLDYEPTKEDLTIKLPKNTQFSDKVNTLSAKTLYRDHKENWKTISVDDIENIYNQLQVQAKDQEKKIAELNERKKLSSVRSLSKSTYVLIGVNVFVFLCVGIYFLKRKKKQS